MAGASRGGAVAGPMVARAVREPVAEAGAAVAEAQAAVVRAAPPAGAAAAARAELVQAALAQAALAQAAEVQTRTAPVSVRIRRVIPVPWPVPHATPKSAAGHPATHRACVPLLRPAATRSRTVWIARVASAAVSEGRVRPECAAIRRVASAPPIPSDRPMRLSTCSRLVACVVLSFCALSCSDDSKSSGSSGDQEGESSGGTSDSGGGTTSGSGGTNGGNGGSGGSAGSVAGSGGDSGSGNGGRGGSDPRGGSSGNGPTGGSSGESGGSAGSSGSAGSGGSGGSAGSTDGANPYGRCESDDDCPLSGSNCHATYGCEPPCDSSAEPDLRCAAAPPGGEAEPLCEGAVCRLDCSFDVACPTGMTCDATWFCTPNP